VLLLSLSPLLEGINLRKNHLSGSIPEGIRQLSLLTELILYENELTSSIPELSKLTNLGGSLLASQVTGHSASIESNKNSVSVHRESQSPS
jgi:hypothetical protein